MQRRIIIFGIVSGVAVIGFMILSMTLAGPGSLLASEYLGYLVMLIALSVIFVAIRQYRDGDLGGIITFGTGVTIGVGISFVAGAAYVAAWEAYLAATDFAFVDDYVRSVLAAEEARGASAAELAALEAEMDEFRTLYANPAVRLPMTFLEIFPVGLVVTLASAFILRRGAPGD